jgi:hypothetical protein
MICTADGKHWILDGSVVIFAVFCAICFCCPSSRMPTRAWAGVLLKQPSAAHAKPPKISIPRSISTLLRGAVGIHFSLEASLVQIGGETK